MPGRVVSPADVWMMRQEINEPPQPHLHTFGASRRLRGDVVKHAFEIVESVMCITKPHKPCFAHTRRTSASVANSRRAAAASERASTSSSSGVSMTGFPSSPAKLSISRARSSCIADGRRRA